MDELPSKLLQYLQQTPSGDDQTKIVRQALEHFKDTRDPALGQQVEADVAQKYANQETTELKRLREENNILRKGVRALNQRNNKWCKAQEELRAAADEIKSLQFRNTLLQ